MKVGKLKIKPDVYDMDKILKSDVVHHKINYEGIPEFYKERIRNAINVYESAQHIPFRKAKSL